MPDFTAAPTPSVAPSVAPSVTLSVTLSVVIVSYNTRELTLRCLREVSAHLEREALSHEIWVVDNASRDGSAAAIAQAIAGEMRGVHLIASERNLGFGAANNRAMAQARGEWLLLLNSDAFAKPGALSHLVEFGRAHPRAGVIGPRLLHPDGTLQVSCWKFPSPARVWLEAVGLARVMASHPRLGDYYRWAHDEVREVDFAIGACLLVRREVWEEVGGFDESFFLYAEETDWQKRVHAAGWQVVFTPDALVTHLGGASGAGEKNRVSALFWEGQERYMLKHHGRAGWLAMRAGVLVGAVARAACCQLLLMAGRRRADTRAKLRFFLRQAWRVLAARGPRMS